MLPRIISLGIFAVFWLLISWLLPGTPAYVLSSALGIVLFFINRYPDKFLLHFLQAREIIESDYPAAYRLARAESHRLQIPVPTLYSYSGFFQRAFCLAAEDRLAFVVERTTLEKAATAELRALFFGLGLEHKKRIARSQTLALLVVALVWAPALKLVSLWSHRVSSLSWIVQYVVGNLTHWLYRISMPQYKWRRYLAELEKHDWEYARLCELNAKLEQPRLGASLSRELQYRFYSAHHPAPQQLILALEGVAQSLDFLRDPTQSVRRA